MRPSKIIILFAVALLIFGSAGFFAYKLFWKPYGKTNISLFCWKKKTNSLPAAAAVTDPSLKDFEAAIALQQAGKILEAQQALQSWLQAYPSSPKKKEALTILGKINMEQLCSPSSTTDKETYIVVKGDSLDRIARKKKSSAELIQKINGLPNINLQIGETLFIPQLQTSLDIDRQAALLILLNHGQFLKSYPLLSMPPAGNRPLAGLAAGNAVQGASGTQRGSVHEVLDRASTEATPQCASAVESCKRSSEQKPFETAIIDKIAMNGNKRTAFGDKKYPESEQIILLRSAGNIVTAPPTAPTAAELPPASTNAPASNIASTSATNSNTQQNTNTGAMASATPGADATIMPPGFVLSPADMREVFPFIGKSTSVTIH